LHQNVFFLYTTLCNDPYLYQASNYIVKGSKSVSDTNIKNYLSFPEMHVIFYNTLCNTLSSFVIHCLILTINNYVVYPISSCFIHYVDWLVHQLLVEKIKSKKYFLVYSEHTISVARDSEIARKGRQNEEKEKKLPPSKNS